MVAVQVLKQVVLDYLYGVSFKQMHLRGYLTKTKQVSVHTWLGRVMQILLKMKYPGKEWSIPVCFQISVGFSDRDSE